MGELIPHPALLDAIRVPPLRPRDELRLAQLGAQLGQALDAGELPATVARRPERLIDVVQPPQPLVVWRPSRLQWAAARLRRKLRKLFHGR